MSELKRYQNREIHWRSSHPLQNMLYISLMSLMSHTWLILTFKKKNWDTEIASAELSYIKSKPSNFSHRKTWDSKLGWNKGYTVDVRKLPALYDSVSILLISSVCSLDPTNEWNHMVLVFLWLAYFTWLNIPQVHPCCHKG